MKKLCAVLGAVLILTSCSSVNSVPSDVVSRLKKIGFISLTAHELRQKRIGTTVFNNKEQVYDISEWGIDDEFERQASAAALVKLNTFEVVDVDYDQENLFAVYGRPDALLYPKLKWGLIEEEIQKVAKAYSLDAVVMLVASESCYNYICQRGLELTYEKRFGFDPGSWAGLSSNIALLDGYSGKLIASKSARGFYWGKIDEELSLTAIDSFSQVQKDELKEVLIVNSEDKWLPNFRRFFGI